MSPTYLYLIATVLFILGIKGLCKVRTARTGNLLAALGMLIAVIGALVESEVLDLTWIIVGLAVGGVVGLALSARVPLTKMPELVAAFNGTGGASSAFVALAALGAIWSKLGEGGKIVDDL